MKMLFPLLAVWIPLAGCSQKISGEREQSSYRVGYEIGHGLRLQGASLDEAMVLRGLKEGLAGGKSSLSPAEGEAAKKSFARQMGERQKALGLKAEEGSRELLEKNRGNEGWVTTKSGLQYKVLKAGKGKKPGADSTVLVHYTGTLWNGIKFDSSRDRGTPSEFAVKDLIPGWGEALRLMPEGSQWALLIPAALAYGEKGSGPVPPGAALLFDLELLKVK